MLQSQSAKVLRVQRGQGRRIFPTALDDYKFYVRDEAETSLAVRDEIVALVREGAWLRDAGRCDPAAAMATKP